MTNSARAERRNGGPEPVPGRRNGTQLPPAPVAEPEVPPLPPAPFDFEDWGSNVTPLAPEDDAAA